MSELNPSRVQDLNAREALNFEAAERAKYLHRKLFDLILDIQVIVARMKEDARNTRPDYGTPYWTEKLESAIERAKPEGR